MQISQKISFVLLSVIVVVAAALRLYQLGQVPHGMTWDEAAIGYNGYAIVTARRDEWLIKLPISFKSFGDYKAPLAVYATGIFTTLLGSELWVLRLPFALSGIVGVVGIYLLMTLLTKNKSTGRLLGLVAAGLLTLSPWHIFFTRVGFESGLALTLVIWLMVLFLHGLKQAKSTVWFVGSTTLGVLSLYAYHSAKVFIPLLGLLLLVLYRRELLQKVSQVVPAGIAAILVAVPVLYDSVWGNGLERAGVTVFSRGNSLVQNILVSVQQFADHLSPQFLFLGETTTLRHGTGEWGVFLPTTVLLMAFFVGFAIYQAITRKLSRTYLLLLCWTLVGIIPAAIATESPHANRSLLALPGFIGMASFGLWELVNWLKQTKLHKQWLDSKSKANLLVPSVLGTLLNIHILLFLGFTNDYFTNFNAISAEAFQDGYAEAVKIANEYQKGLNGKPKVEQVVFSRGYGQPYIYILYFNRINPIAYHGGILQPYLFVDSVGIGDMQRQNVLLVATAASELSEKKATHVIYAEDGSVRFKLYYLSPKE